jgi:tRNA uridine 5-carbamoylmethylation protein Kti12
MTTLTLMRGYPGSGKTTLADLEATKRGVAIWA